MCYTHLTSSQVCPVVVTRCMKLGNVRLGWSLHKVSVIVSEIARVGYTQTDRPIISLVTSWSHFISSKKEDKLKIWIIFNNDKFLGFFHVKHWMGWILIFVVLGNLFICMVSGGRTGWCVISLCKFWGLCSGVNKDVVCLGSLILKSRRWRWHVLFKHWGTSRTVYPVTQRNIPEIVTLY